MGEERSRLKRFYLLLIVILVGLISVSIIAGRSMGNGSHRENMVQATPYEISGNRRGQVTVKDSVTGKVIRTFQMQEGVVRELFLLDDGKTVAASQKDHAVFWNLPTGQEIRHFDERIYGFSHDQTRFFIYNQEGVFLYAYPTLKLVCQLAKGPMIGPEAFLFSPDDHFLAILFASGRPASDEYYPGTEPIFRGIRYSRLFNIKICQEVEEFSKLDVAQLGMFSRDSKFYELKEALIFIEDRYLRGAWRFNLANNKIEKWNK